ncbi:hypothetical protein P3W23_00350 [Luteibacter sp. PPL554]
MSVRLTFVVAWVAITVLLHLATTEWAAAGILAVVPALVAAAFRWLARRWRPSSSDRGQAPLTVTERPDGWTVIDARPEPLPALFTVLPVLFGFLAAGMVANLGGPWRSFGELAVSAVLAWGVAGGLLAVWAHRLQNGRRGVQPAAFAVSAGAVRLPSGMTVPIGRIYALTLRNGVDPHVSWVLSTSTIAAASSLGAAHAAAKVARIAYRVDLDHDGHSTTLAGGLTEPQARAVAAEVLRKLPSLH